MTLKTSLQDMCLLQRNTPGNLSDVSEPEELLLRCKQLYERYLFQVNANLSQGAKSSSNFYLSLINDLTLNDCCCSKVVLQVASQRYYTRRVLPLLSTDSSVLKNLQ